MRVLFWLLVGGLLVLAVRRLARGPGRSVAPAKAEDMVACAACGLNLPKSEAIAVDGHWACSTEHARVGN
jgi:uncharacterized protein